jgi:hypothetical protein
MQRDNLCWLAVVEEGEVLIREPGNRPSILDPHRNIKPDDSLACVERSAGRIAERYWERSITLLRERRCGHAQEQPHQNATVHQYWN